jgi:DNA replication protein DnaC
VVLDDVGSEKDPQAIQELLDYRYARQLPTIATSGLTRQELVQHLGAAYVRRIIEQHAGHAVLVWDGFDA